MRRLIPIMMIAGLALAGCGGDKDPEGADKACSPAPTTAPGGVTVPAGFPVPDGAAMTQISTQGPTTVLDGFSGRKLGDLFQAYKSSLGQAPYSVTKSEKDAHDAEVNFESADSTGQVKLQDSCRDRVSIRVTSRPR